MRILKLSHWLGIIAIAAVAVLGLLAADHVDSPSVANTTSDIADLYAFEGEDENSTVFIATLQGPLMPGTETQNAEFDEDVLIEFNIDNTGDFVEDLVIQAIPRGDTMYFVGPRQPAQTGLNSTLTNDLSRAPVAISSGSNQSITTSSDGMKFYAGARRDPFFFDFNRFNEIAAGNVAPIGFLPPAQANDFFDNLNVLAVVVEVPNSLLGSAPAHVGGNVNIPGLPNAYNVWVSTKRKQ